MRNLLSAVFAVSLYTGAAHAALFSQFVVFGDSLSDNGNAYLATKTYLGPSLATPAPPAYTLGRFTDGPDSTPATTATPALWHEVLSGLLSEPVATPFFAGPTGTNFAVGGAQVLQDVPVTGLPIPIPSLESQVGLYLTRVGGIADPNALYIIWGGANDLYTAVETPGETAAGIAATETAMVGSLATDIGALYASGARDFLWLNLPQLATTPRGAFDLTNAPGLATAFADASTQFQADVASESAALDHTLRGARIADVDIYSLYQNVIAHPGTYGFTNVTTPAQGLSVNPDQYLFWDFPSHPTTTGHRLIGLDAEASVLSVFTPEPATWAFAGAGLLLVVWLRRARRA